MENTEFTNDSMDDIVFEKRNKAYGAYLLRKEFTRNFLTAMIWAVSAITILAFSPNIYSYIARLFGAEDKVEVQNEIIVEAIIEDIPLDNELPPPPAIDIPPPKVEMIRFLPPEIKPDILVKNEEIPPTDEELEEVKNIGNIDQEGDTNLVMIDSGPGNKIIDDGDDDRVYLSVQEKAIFVGGGEPAMIKFIQKNQVYPKKAERMGIEGTVVTYFEIDKEGKVSNAKILKGINEDLDGEALRVVKMMPTWKPAKQNGKPVRSRMIIPLKFTL